MSLDALLDNLTLLNVVISLFAFTGFSALLFLGTKFLPGKEVQGVELKDGTRQDYRLNGFLLYLVSTIVFTALGFVGIATGSFSVGSVIKYFIPLFVAANIFSVALTGLLYVTELKGGRERGEVPEDEATIMTLWLGPSLNPTWWGVDLKFFSYRPSLIGLGLLNIAFGFLQYERFGDVTNGMLLFQFFTYFYLGSSFQFERGMLSMWDIIAERFGFMLIWGDYALVPFFYCIAGFTLAGQTTDLPLWGAAFLVILFFFGFWVFRGANEQKNRFKADPNTKIWGKPAETVGGRLLVSGFWGIGRKLNYTGEITLYLAWAMTAGFESFGPYLLPLWLFSLLTHRAWRDEQRCKAKYGPVWDEYCKRAKFRMFPFIY